MSGPEASSGAPDGGAHPPAAGVDARFDAEAWRDRLVELGARLRRGVRDALARTADRARLSATVGEGAGDRTFGIDAVAEGIVDGWLLEVAAEGPISLLTEDAGWRHAGPAGPLDGFAHGGPRVSLDPIDGTRHLMHDLRPAWVVAAACPPGAAPPRLSDVAVGVLTELPDTRAAVGRELAAVRGGGALVREVVLGARAADPTPWRPTPPLERDGRVDGGHLPFFGFEPRCRAAAQALAADVFEAIARRADVDLEAIQDDQYTSSGGQLALIALGAYRGVVDARASLGRAHGFTPRTAKPYDVAGAVIVAKEAGAVVCAPGGGTLDAPLDAVTPVEFAAFADPRVADLVTSEVARVLATTRAGRG